MKNNVGISITRCSKWENDISHSFLFRISTLKFGMDKNRCSTVLYTPTACPMDSDRLSSDPATSNGLSGQSIKSPSESVGHDWILLLVQAKSSESPLSHLKARNGWTGWNSVSVGLPLDFCWISTGLRQKPVIFAKSSVHWTSAGLPLDFRWTSGQKSCKRVLSGDCSHSLLLL